jgi:hypothetical protein
MKKYFMVLFLILFSFFIYSCSSQNVYTGKLVSITFHGGWGSCWELRFEDGTTTLTRHEPSGGSGHWTVGHVYTENSWGHWHEK